MVVRLEGVIEKRIVYGRQVVKRMNKSDGEGVWRRRSKIVMLKRGC